MVPSPGCCEIRFGLARLAGFEALLPTFAFPVLAIGVVAPESLFAQVTALAAEPACG